MKNIFEILELDNIQLDKLKEINCNYCSFYNKKSYIPNCICFTSEQYGNKINKPEQFFCSEYKGNK